MTAKTVVIAGGGAAGFFCAVNLAARQPGWKVLLLEKSGKLLSKVRISGGGRCNVTHNCFEAAELVKRYPRGGKFLLKSFRHFGPADTVAWFEKRGVALKAEADGRIFPVSDDSSSITSCLLEEARKYGVEIRLGEELQYLQKEGDRWILQTGKESFRADAVCICCGGFPKPGQYEWLGKTGHHIELPVPSLFTFNMPGHAITKLMGVVVDPAQVKLEGSRLTETGALLITHWGMSGPVVLRLSAWGACELAAAGWHFSVQVNWIPAFHENSAREFMQAFRQEKGNQKLANRNPFQLPQRFWEYLLQEADADGESRWADLPAKNQNRLAKLLTAQVFDIQGKTTFKEEFVTAGGIKLSEVNPDTMESRLHTGLYFAGEILDVDGITGGFNFQHAWTSGWLAARAMAGQQTALPGGQSGK